MHYLTRHLEALRDLTHGDAHVQNGQRFHATEVDAEYYLGRGQAKEVPAAAAAPSAPPAEPPAHAPVEVPAPVTVESVAAVPAEQQPAAESAAAAPAAIATRRRTAAAPARTPPAEA